MSRSRRKPWFTDQQRGSTKGVKRRANRAVRKAEDPPANGKAYRKEFESYDIRDWSFPAPKNPKAYRK